MEALIQAAKEQIESFYASEGYLNFSGAALCKLLKKISANSIS